MKSTEVIAPQIGAEVEQFAANLGIEDFRYALTVHMSGARLTLPTFRITSGKVRPSFIGEWL
jgi:hypothetical protein